MGNLWGKDELELTQSLRGEYVAESYPYLLHRSTNQLCLLHKITTNSAPSSQNIAHIIEQYGHSKCASISVLKGHHRLDNKGVCSDEEVYYLIFQGQNNYTLKQEVTKRRFYQVPFREDEIRIIIETYLCGLREYDHRFQRDYEQLGLQSIVIDLVSKRICLRDPWLGSKPQTQSTSNRAQLIQTYPSPEKLAAAVSPKVETYNELLSNLFSVGVLSLELKSLNFADSIYTKKKELNYDEIRRRTSEFRDSQLRRGIELLLNLDPLARKQIFTVWGIENREEHYLVPVNQDKNMKEKYEKAQQSHVAKPAQPQFTNNRKNIANSSHNMGASSQPIRFSFADHKQHVVQRSTQEVPAEREKQQVVRVQREKEYVPPSQSVHHHLSPSQSVHHHLPPPQMFQSSSRPVIQFRNNNSQPKITIQPPRSGVIINQPPEQAKFVQQQLYRRTAEPKLQFSVPNGNNHGVNDRQDKFLDKYYQDLPRRQNPKQAERPPFQRTIEKRDIQQNRPKTFLSFHEFFGKEEVQTNRPLTDRPYSSNDDRKIVIIGSNGPEPSKQSQTHAKPIFGAHKESITFYEHPPQIKESPAVIKSASIEENQPSRFSSLEEKEKKPEVVQQAVKKESSKHQRSLSDQISPVKPHPQKAEDEMLLVKQQEQEGSNSEMTPQRPPAKNKYNSTIVQVRDEDTPDHSNKSEDPAEEEYVVEEYETGSRYEGFKSNGMRNGRGKFYYQDGGYYQGHWKNNKMDGHGKLYYEGGKLAYDGMWAQDEFNGVGVVYNDNPLPLATSFDYTNFDYLEDYWQYYEGMLCKDTKEGRGLIKLSNGEVFEGDFHQDKIQGFGKFHTMDGQTIEGMWKDSKLIKVINN